MYSVHDDHDVSYLAIEGIENYYLVRLHINKVASPKKYIGYYYCGWEGLVSYMSC